MVRTKMKGKVTIGKNWQGAVRTETGWKGNVRTGKEVYEMVKTEQDKAW